MPDHALDVISGDGAVAVEVLLEAIRHAKLVVVGVELVGLAADGLDGGKEDASIAFFARSSSRCVGPSSASLRSSASTTPWISPRVCPGRARRGDAEVAVEAHPVLVRRSRCWRSAGRRPASGSGARSSIRRGCEPAISSAASSVPHALVGVPVVVEPRELDPVFDVDERVGDELHRRHRRASRWRGHGECCRTVAAPAPARSRA